MSLLAIGFTGYIPGVFESGHCLIRLLVTAFRAAHLQLQDKVNELGDTQQRLCFGGGYREAKRVYTAIKQKRGNSEEEQKQMTHTEMSKLNTSKML